MDEESEDGLSIFEQMKLEEQAEHERQLKEIAELTAIKSEDGLSVYEQIKSEEQAEHERQLKEVAELAANKSEDGLNVFQLHALSNLAKDENHLNEVIEQAAIKSQETGLSLFEQAKKDLSDYLFSDDSTEDMFKDAERIRDEAQRQHEIDLIEREKTEKKEKEELKAFCKDNYLHRTFEHPLLDFYEKDYITALNNIKTKVGELIGIGKDVKAMFLQGESVEKIKDIYKSLHGFYAFVYSQQELSIKNNSIRFKQLKHELLETKEMFEEAHPKESEEYILNHLVSKYKVLTEAGFPSDEYEGIHPLVVSEIAYMIEVLRIMLEPDFIENNASDSEESKDKPNRHITSSVKQYVWRRDEGKCTECGSNEKLEYDHIIPVAKGGSNTERNIQLLCEACNRQKSANIK